MHIRKYFVPSVVVAATVLLTLAANTYSQEMSYETILNLGIQCTGRHSCVEGTINSNFSLRNCECDNKCNHYEDCCIDSDSRRSSSRRSSTPLYRCINDKNSKLPVSVYAISKCKNGWKGAAYIRQNCEQSQDNVTDPIMATPATDSGKRRTYRNRYCAECNNVDASSLTLWNVMIFCDLKTKESVTKEYIQNNLRFSRSTGKWGINYRNDSLSDAKFHECELGFGLPQSVERQKVRRCRPRVISNCPSDYKRQVVIRQCASYMGVVYTSKGIYKNPHCGMCNGIDLKKMRCSQSDLHVTDRSKTVMSFIDIINFNMPPDRCSGGQFWDAFYKKCRSPVCTQPGASVVNGKCVSG